MSIQKAGNHLKPNSLKPSRNKYPSKYGTSSMHLEIAANMTAFQHQPNIHRRSLVTAPTDRSRSAIPWIFSSITQKYQEASNSARLFSSGPASSNVGYNPTKEDTFSKKHVMAKDKGKAVDFIPAKIQKHPIQVIIQESSLRNLL
ncbi:hypothetical protein LINGRAHAP2_LOCUS7725 [Linum grandiflorum]